MITYNDRLNCKKVQDILDEECGTAKTTEISVFI